MSAFRIEQVQKATVNGRAVKLFSVYKKSGDSFVFSGRFSAPANIPNSKLAEFYLSVGADNAEQQ